MGGSKASGDMTYFQIRISHEQAKHLPGYVITKYFDRLELVTGTGLEDSIPSCIVKVEHKGVDIMSIKDELEGSLIIDALLQYQRSWKFFEAKN
jgi:hypothetical protein